MSKSKTLILFFITLSLTMTLLNHTNGLYATDDITTKAVDKSYSLKVSSSYNNSEYFILIEGAVFEFSISVQEWGSIIQGPYNGLMIQLVLDQSETIYDSWLINHGDTGIHHFTTGVEIYEIIRVRVSSLYVEECLFNFTVSDVYPIWAYSLNLNLEPQFFFGVERFAEYYYRIDKLVTILDSKYLETANYTLNLLNRNQTTIKSETDNFAISDVSELNLEIAEGVFEGDWYEIIFNFNDYNAENDILISLFYDHIQTENIARLFINTGEKNLDEIPIDKKYSDLAFQWKIINDSIDTNTTRFIIGNPIYVLCSILYLAGVFIAFKFFQRRKKNKAIDYNLNKNKVEYSPKLVYDVDFQKKDINYNLVTREAITVTCSICLQTISKKNTIIRCPSCDIAFHKNHLYQWLVGNGTCPACNARLKIQKE
ncbi:MAG: E3 ubiquitin protein ligase [Candidatus Heimdallarchaeota archaeon]|nr:E3 ubiquitin protein ligase [Candidatus Heimdallarchaeota archaeon]MCG3256773.1 E3 ubiquitin protein ligase [Candidatus Heimdallarchaeota archaeon]MCK4611836.1 E3 ubiquitin protein ligase [Candidatus Heimdallarchaeota archaeon]